MQINPILIKEMKVRARIVRIPIFLMAYNAVLAFIGIVMLVNSADTFGVYGYSNYRMMNEVFAGMGMVQCAMIILVTLIVSAGAFSGEREKGTLDMLLMTPVTTWEVVNGKMSASILTSFMFTFSSLPIMALGTIYGGTNIVDMIYLQCILLILSVLSGSIGLLCSSMSGKTSIAVGFALITEATLIIGPFIFLDFLSSFFYNSYQYVTMESPLVLFAAILLSFNPVMLIIRFYDRIMGSNLLMDIFYYSYGVEESSTLYGVLEEYFPETCTVAQLLLSVLILYIIVKLLKKGRNMR